MMLQRNEFIEEMQKGYSFAGESFKLGAAMLEGSVVHGAEVRVPFATLNRHV